jgi:hypothetical protein
MTAVEAVRAAVSGTFSDAMWSEMLQPAHDGPRQIDMNTVAMPSRHAWGTTFGSKHMGDILQNTRDACVVIAGKLSAEAEVVAEWFSDPKSVHTAGGRINLVACWERRVENDDPGDDGASGLVACTAVLGTIEFFAVPGRVHDMCFRVCNAGAVDTGMWIYGHTSKPTAPGAAPTSRRTLGGYGQGAKMLTQCLAADAPGAPGRLQMTSVVRVRDTKRNRVSRWTFRPAVVVDAKTGLQRIFIKHSAVKNASQKSSAVSTILKAGSPCCVVSTLTLFNTTVAQVAELLRQNPFCWPTPEHTPLRCPDGITHATVIMRADDQGSPAGGATHAPSARHPLLVTVGGIFLSNRAVSACLEAVDLHVGYMPLTTEGRHASVADLVERLLTALEGVGGKAPHGTEAVVDGVWRRMLAATLNSEHDTFEREALKTVCYNKYAYSGAVAAIRRVLKDSVVVLQSELKQASARAVLAACGVDMVRVQPATLWALSLLESIFTEGARAPTLKGLQKQAVATALKGAQVVDRSATTPWSTLPEHAWPARWTLVMANIDPILLPGLSRVACCKTTRRALVPQSIFATVSAPEVISAIAAVDFVVQSLVDKEMRRLWDSSLGGAGAAAGAGKPVLAQSPSAMSRQPAPLASPERRRRTEARTGCSGLIDVCAGKCVVPKSLCRVALNNVVPPPGAGRRAALHETTLPTEGVLPSVPEGIEPPPCAHDSEPTHCLFETGLRLLLTGDAAAGFSQPVWCSADWTSAEAARVTALLVDTTTPDNDYRRAVATLCADIRTVACIMCVDPAPFCLCVERPRVEATSVVEAFNHGGGDGSHHIFVCVGAFLQQKRLLLPERARHEWLLGTLAHELAHNTHGPHNRAFYDCVTDTLSSVAIQVSRQGVAPKRPLPAASSTQPRGGKRFRP